MIEHQAGCVQIGGRALLIEGAPGSGKSSLALALIDRGARLIGDDGVVLSQDHDELGARLIARPHPRTRGLIEVRNLGLLTFPVSESAPVTLVVRLDDDAPRYIARAGERLLGGLTIPLVRLTPRDPVLALKAELALDRYGLGAPPHDDDASLMG